MNLIFKNFSLVKSTHKHKYKWYLILISSCFFFVFVCVNCNRYRGKISYFKKEILDKVALLKSKWWLRKKWNKSTFISHSILWILWADCDWKIFFFLYNILPMYTIHIYYIFFIFESVNARKSHFNDNKFTFIWQNWKIMGTNEIGKIRIKLKCDCYLSLSLNYYFVHDIKSQCNNRILYKQQQPHQKRTKDGFWCENEIIIKRFSKTIAFMLLYYNVLVCLHIFLFLCVSYIISMLAKQII